MIQDFDFMSQSIDLFRQLSGAMLSGSEELIAANLDSAQALVSRCSKQLRAAISDVRSLETPEQASAAQLAGIRIPFELTRHAVLATSECHVKSLRLLQQQAAEAHQLLCDTFAPTLAALHEDSSRPQRTRKASAISHRQSA